MKNLLSLLFTLFTVFSFSQQSESYAVTFENMSDDYFQNTVSYPQPKTKAQFHVISAYTFAPETVEIYYRLKLDNNWNQWSDFDQAHGTEGQERQAFEGVFIYEEFDSIQFASKASLSKEVIFRMYTAIEETEEEITINSNISQQNIAQLATCACAQPVVCLRNCWCPDGSCPKDITTTPTQVSHFIIHHSAGGNNATDFAAVVASYWDLHVNTNGWDDIGYNWLIDPNGVVYEGRGSGVQGAHFSCMNETTTGICMVGNFNSISPSDTAFSSLKQLLAWESCDKNIVLTDTSFHQSSQLNLPHVSTHRDGNVSTAPNSCAVGTVCPGDSLYANFRAASVNPAAALNCTKGVDLNEVTLADFELYPNPANEMVTIRLGDFLAGKPISITLFDMKGTPVKQLFSAIGNTAILLNVANVSEGIYVLEINTEAQAVRKRLILN